jgi:hypothetical protein
MIVPTANYPTSRDYHQLWKLTHAAAIVCIVDCDPGKSDCRDIARTAHSPDDLPQLVQIGSRGACYVWAETIEDFIAQCQQCNLEWLVPTMWDHAWSYGKPDETDITDESCLPHNAILLPGASPPAPEPGLVEEPSSWSGSIVADYPSALVLDDQQKALAQTRAFLLLADQGPVQPQS